MADAPTAPPAPPPAETKAPNPPNEYSLKWEPVGKFSLEELFLNSFVRAKVWVADAVPVIFRSLIGEEIDKVHEGVKVVPNMTRSHFQTEQTYWNLAFALEQIGDKQPQGTFEERLAAIRKMSAPLLMRLAIGYLEFSGHVEDLFEGKGGMEAAKKS